MGYTLSEAYSPISTTKINYKFYLREYDEILTGRRKSFSGMVSGEHETQEICEKLLRYIFENYLHWSPEQVAECLSEDVIKRNCLTSLISHIPCPPELNRRRDLYFVAWDLYPEIKKMTPAQLLAKTYDDICEGRLKKFPKKYFDGPEGRDRARLLFQLMLTKFLPQRFANMEQMYSFFAKDVARSYLSLRFLSTPLKELYGNDCLAYMHDSLPNDRDEALYHRFKHESAVRKAASSKKSVAQTILENDAATEKPTKKAVTITQPKLYETEDIEVCSMGSDDLFDEDPLAVNE